MQHKLRWVFEKFDPELLKLRQQERESKCWADGRLGWPHLEAVWSRVRC